MANLDVATENRFEGRWYRFEVGCWAIMFLIVMAALVGMAGDGPFAHVRVEGSTSVLEYDHIVRNRSSTRLVLWLHNPTSPVRVYLAESLLEKLTLARLARLP